MLDTTHSRDYKLYLVKWEGLPDSYNFWIIGAELLKHNREVTVGDLEPGGSEILKETEDDAEHGFGDITADLIRDWWEHSKFK